MSGFKGISRLGDITTGHGCHAPVIGATASANVYVNGIPAHKVGDTTVVHTCGTDVHPDTMSVGSTTVKINGTDAMRIGDILTPGGTIAEGSHNVFVGV